MNNQRGFVDWWVMMSEKIAACESHDEILDFIGIEAASLGFNNYAYAIRTTEPFTRPKTYILGSYPNEWIKRYHAKNYGPHDPTIELGIRRKKLILWDRKVHKENPQLFGEANEWGLKYGATFTTKGVDNTLQVLSFSRKHEDISKKEEPIINLTLKCLLDICYDKMREINVHPFYDFEITLSPREKEILQWTADGKSASEISIILGITIHTVNFHLKNIQKKMGVNNKTASVARAVALSLI
ncbi:autoinducer binding domain-containing protein [Aidingimonas halophila]|uniref:LuxR family transcriptional regulator, transcriptional activator of rhlAB and lasB n=1 Tax=Aidingimonas halophila TaxID=574349 RepID=A0A1H2U362_9GAMM|nr:autoinducer binding domain-containing protein [Aidingimonas halophila]GHC38834.1 regulatory protein RhlR [Aidingimonas halophila]SDW50009.1 LuxR family transcriptional regulator, transcriptional activator of rhlAB and lasB [Aidingimonas halophila]